MSHQVFLAIVLWGTSAISIGYYAPSLGVSVTYAFFVALPVTLSFFVIANGHEFNVIMGVLGVIYLAVQCVFSIKINRYFNDNLSLQLDNVELTKEFVHEVKSRMTAEEIAKDCHCR